MMKDGDQWRMEASFTPIFVSLPTGQFSSDNEVAVALEKQDFSSSLLIQHPEHDGLWTASQKSAGDSTFYMKEEEREIWQSSQPNLMQLDFWSRADTPIDWFSVPQDVALTLLENARGVCLLEYCCALNLSDL